MKTKIKLLALYYFNDLTCSDGTDFGGLWEAREAKDLNTNRPEFLMVRTVSFSEGQKIGDQQWLPYFLLEAYVSKVDRESLKGVRVAPTP